MGSEFLRIKGVLDQIQETEDERNMIAEVLRIKAILDDTGYKPEWVLCDLLKKLKQMVVSMKVLEATMIGKSVSRVGHDHAVSLKDVRRIARMLIVSWRRVVDEWMIANDDHVSVSQEEEQGGGSSKNRQKEKQESKHSPTNLCNVSTEKGKAVVEVRKRKPDQEPMLQPKKRCFFHDDKKKQSTVAEERRMRCASVKTVKLQNPNLPVTFDVEAKVEAAKRKLHEGYKEAENRKRQRRTQVIEVHDVLRLCLAHKDHRSRFRNHMIKPCAALVR